MTYSNVMRIFASVMTLLFLICVGLQYNDPDPLVWMAIYGAAAGVSLAVVLGKPFRIPAAIIALIALGWALLLFSGIQGAVHLTELAETMKAEKPAIEEARESGGLLIVALSMGVFLLFPHRRA